MTLTVTGATGHLGTLVIEDLLERGVAASDIVALVRSPEKAAPLAAQGIEIRQAAYDDPASLRSALAGTDRLLLISSSEVGSRVPQHKNVIDAAVEAGVGSIAYTSILGATTSGLALAAEHKATEELIRASGIPFTLLRNGWYMENYTANLDAYLQTGAVLGAAGDGRFTPATRADYAAAAAAVLATDGHENAVYELGGDEAYTLSDLAAAVAEVSGKAVVYTSLPADEYIAALTSVGVPEPFAQVLADSDLGLERGELYTDSGHLGKLIGRPTTTLQEAVRSALN